MNREPKRSSALSIASAMRVIGLLDVPDVAVCQADENLKALHLRLVCLAGRVIPFGSMKRLYVMPRRCATFFRRCVSFFPIPCVFPDIPS